MRGGCAICFKSSIVRFVVEHVAGLGGVAHDGVTKSGEEAKPSTVGQASLATRSAAHALHRLDPIDEITVFIA